MFIRCTFYESENNVKLPQHKDPLFFLSLLNVRKVNGNQFQFKNSIENISVKHIDHNHSAYFFSLSLLFLLLVPKKYHEGYACKYIRFLMCI